MVNCVNDVTVVPRRWSAEDHIIELHISADQLERAMAREDAFKRKLTRRNLSCLNNSIRKGCGDFIGILGEELLHDFYPGQWERTPEDNPYHWDLRLSTPPQATVDVKTKTQTYDQPPRGHYFATVCDKNITQQCDMYWFVRIHHMCERAWLLGYMPKKQFFQQAKKYLKGEPDPTSHNGWRFKEDCWNLPVSDLLAPPKTSAELHALQLLHFLPTAPFYE